MKIKLFLWFLMTLVLIAPIFAQSLNGINSGQTEISYGSNATADLPMFSKTYIKVYEGSKIDFNIVDPDNFNILIRNSIIIRDVNDLNVTTLLSVDGSEYEEVFLDTGEVYAINYTYGFNKWMEIIPLITHPDEDPSKSNVVLYFLVPTVKTTNTDFSDVKDEVLNKGKERTAVDKAFMVVVAIIIVVILALVFLNSRDKKVVKSKKRAKLH